MNESAATWTFSSILTLDVLSLSSFRTSFQSSFSFDSAAVDSVFLSDESLAASSFLSASVVGDGVAVAVTVVSLDGVLDGVIEPAPAVGASEGLAVSLSASSALSLTTALAPSTVTL